MAGSFCSGNWLGCPSFRLMRAVTVSEMVGPPFLMGCLGSAAVRSSFIDDFGGSVKCRPELDELRSATLALVAYASAMCLVGCELDREVLSTSSSVFRRPSRLRIPDRPWEACSVQSSPATVPEPLCAEADLDPSARRDLHRALVEVRQAGSDRQQARALALAAFHFREDSVLDRVLEDLPLAELDASSAAELAMVYLARGAKRQDSRDLVRALDLAERAVRAEPSSAATWFNVAVLRRRLGLTSRAGQALAHSLRRETDEAWREESILFQAEIEGGGQTAYRRGTSSAAPRQRALSALGTMAAGGGPW